MLDEALREWDVNSEVLTVGKNAGSMSALAPWTRAQRKKVGGLIDATYANFKQVGVGWVSGGAWQQAG